MDPAQQVGRALGNVTALHRVSQTVLMDENTEEGPELGGASAEHVSKAKEFCFTLLCGSQNSSKSIPQSAKRFSHHTAFKDTARTVL